MKSVTRACGALSLLCLAAALSAPALGAALTDSETFSVTVNLTPVCTLTAPGTLTLDYLDSGPAVSSFTTFTATCSSGVAYQLSLSAADGNALSVPVGAATTYGGTSAGLPYTLEIQDSSGLNPLSPTTAVVAANASATSYRISGSIAGGLTGTCTTTPSDTVSTSVNTCAIVTASRTLTLTY